jgi:carbonic anhydrase
VAETTDVTDADPVATLAEVLRAAAAPGVGGRPPSPAPTRHLVVVTCMDARIDAHRDLGLAVGEAHVIRVAGARVGDDVVRSIQLSTGMLGTRGCLVLGHTDCGLHDRDGRLADRLAQLDPDRDDWGAFSDPAAAVAADVERLRAWPGQPTPWAVAGGVLDVRDGSVTLVVPPA